MITAVAALAEVILNLPRKEDTQMFDELFIVKNSKGVTRLFFEVILLRKITSVTFLFTPKPKKSKDIWDSEFEGYREEETIIDVNGISCRLIHERESMVIRFSSKTEFDRIDDCNDASLFKKNIGGDDKPYQLIISIEDFVGMEWEEPGKSEKK